jgi:16S rRNA G966 N2-methylase RsmD
MRTKTERIAANRERDMAPRASTTLNKSAFMSDAARHAGGDIDAMYGSPFPASRTGALYNAFSYPTKISPEAIGLFIATHTAPGDTILDVFSGSGTTGVASLLCERPTAEMIAMADKMGLRPEWGPRHAHLVDIGTLGCFVSRVLTTPPDPSEFQRAALTMISDAEARLEGLYDAVDPHGAPGQIRHVIWSEVLVCPDCRSEHRLWDVAARRNPALFAKSFVCSSCNRSQDVECCERVEVAGVDVFGRESTTRLRLPVEVHGTTGSKKWSRPVCEADDHVGGWRRYALPDAAPDRDIEWGELRRSGYHAGLDRLHHFYTPRNFLAVATCMELARQYPEPLASALRFLVLSYNASHSTLMTRIVAKKGQPDFVLTGAQSGVLYVSGLPVEKNVLIGLRRKVKVIGEAFRLLHGAQGTVRVHNQSSESLPLPDKSVDYVFTDPPFGDYIPYAELNQINELWLEDVTDRRSETVVSKSGGKDEDHYQRSMSKVFVEVSRVLRDHGRATVVFHSAHARIWRALTEAYESANLRVRKTSVLDKLQASFKQVVSTISVKGDPLILLEKSSEALVVNKHDADIFAGIKSDFQKSASQDVRPYFSRYAAECLAAGRSVSLDAAAFADRMSVMADTA